jgi:thiamine pyrophosphate-dependent acetolactate synthase large subunit-like protein
MGDLWGSDVIATALRATGVSHIALTPGSSFRGLHDSLVNHLGGERPAMLLCLHEEHAVAIAHGYAKVTGEPMAVALHSNVGLMHATMALFNAYCDRVPMIVVGATGPVDAERRRPWIDWVHTSADQGGLIRDYVKWDDQPASVPASVTALLRGNQLTRTHPAAPVYVCLDVTVQEERLGTEPPVPDVARHAPFPPPRPAREDLAAAARLLLEADRPVILAGRVGRGRADWERRVTLAERLGATVITDLKTGAAFPTDHPLHGAPPTTFLSAANAALLGAADTVLSLDWVDLGGTLRRAVTGTVPRVVSASMDHHLFNGWTKNDHVPAPVDVALHCPPDTAVQELLPLLPGRAVTGGGAGESREPGRSDGTGAHDDAAQGAALTVPMLARTLRAVTGDRPVCLIRVPFAWDAAHWAFGSPLDYLGADGGAGVGAGPGLAVGAALALRGRGRLPVAVLGDGDLLMGLTALWTAAHHDIPVLVIVANNTAYHNDLEHQRRIARTRSRPSTNAGVGVEITDPVPDLALLARGQGLTGLGPVHDPGDLAAALAEAVRVVEAGGQAVVDVRVR